MVAFRHSYCMCKYLFDLPEKYENIVKGQIILLKHLECKNIYILILFNFFCAQTKQSEVVSFKNCQNHMYCSSEKTISDTIDIATFIFIYL